MRINIYDEEVTGEVEWIERTADTGIKYYGVRLFLASSEVLDYTPEDDDRSAITFFFMHKDELRQLGRVLKDMSSLLLDHIKDVPATIAIDHE